MAASTVNKSISGVQTRFNKRSQPVPLMKDVSQVVTRNSSSKSSMENLNAANLRKTTTTLKLWRSRRTAEETPDSGSLLDSNEQTSNSQDKEEKPCDDLYSYDAAGCVPLPLEVSVEDGLCKLNNIKDEKDVITEIDDDPDSNKEKSKTGKQLKTLVHRLAPTPGFVDKNSLPSDLQSRRRVRRLASLNAAAKVNVFFEPSSPLAGRSLTDIMQHSKKVQGGESDCDEQNTNQENGFVKSKGRPKLVCISKSDSNYLQSPGLLSEAAHTTIRITGELNDENIPNGPSMKREQDDSADGFEVKRTKVDQNGRYATIITNKRFEKGKEVVDVGVQVELPKKVAGRSPGNRTTYCTCRPSKILDIPVNSYVSTYNNGSLVSIPLTKIHRLTPHVPVKPPPELTQGLACRSKRVAGLNSRAMLNAILTEDRKVSSAQYGTKQHKTYAKKVFSEHGLNNTVPSKLKIPKINFAATSTSNFSAFGRGKVFGGPQGKTTMTALLWQKSAIVSHDGPKRTNGWFFLGTSMKKPYYYNDNAVTRKYYSGIKRNNEVISVRDSVLLKSGPRRKDLPFIARVSGFWEEVEGPNAGEMMMSVLWYYRPEQTEMGKQPHVHGENEIMASRHKDDNSVACIVDRCYVLSYPEYCRYRAAAKRSQDSRVPSATPVPPAQLPDRSATQTPLKTDPKLVFFCRKIYDYRMGRIMKNPFVYNSS